jgi:ATP-dependent DNA ligase
VQLYAFDILALDGEDLCKLALSLRKTNLALLLRDRPHGIFVAPYPALSRVQDACNVLCLNKAARPWPAKCRSY